MITIVSVRGSRVESCARSCRGLPRAFSLVEVLIAILILALGLLGLGAVIPVIVKQQRNATDATLGLAAAKQAEAYIKSRPEFDPLRPNPPANAATPAPSAWYDWLSDTNWSPSLNGYLWQDWRSLTTPELDDNTGDMTFTGPSATDTVIIKLEDRLWPNTSTQPLDFLQGGADPYRPMFVWDIVGRRVQVDTAGTLSDPQSARNPEQIQVAIFVRRVDPNIKIPLVADPANPGASRSITLLDVLVPGRRAHPPVVPCVPVAVESPTNPIPTLRGTSNSGVLYYGNIQRLSAMLDSTAPNRDRITLTSGNGTQIELASRPGQKLLDNLGNVYTVVDAYDDGTGANIVTVDPPVPPFVTDQAPANTTLQIDHSLRQVVFTPQVPGAVRVFTVTRPVP